MIATAGEMKSPRHNLPIAARRYIYRLFFFYIGSVIAIGVTCPSNDPRITSGGSGAGSSAFVVGIKNAGIDVLDSIINAGIIISAWSSGNSFLYLSSRSLYSLALSGNAPSFFKHCTKQGVPIRAVIASSLFCALAYLNVANSGTLQIYQICANVLLTYIRRRGLQLVRELDQHFWLHLLDLLLNHLPSIPQSLQGSGHYQRRASLHINNAAMGIIRSHRWIHHLNPHQWFQRLLA